mmetsp:Transcript_21071/g.38085  ORF Transcript_21071/g.38085 Transcript_21071/m.38085 type:complete len:270 (+) Transcript_21071:255-1064(+)
MAKVTKRLKLHPLLNEHGQDRFHGLLHLISIHLGHERVGRPRQHGRSTQPQLITLGTITHECQFGHVGSCTSIRAASHANDNLLAGNVHLGEHGAHTFDVGRHDAFRLGLGQSTKGKGGTGHGESGEGVHLFDGCNPMLTQNRLDALLVLGIDISENNGLGGTHNRMNFVLVNHRPQSTLESKGSLVLHASVIHMLSVEQLSIALFPPSHPIIVLPVLHGTPRSNLLAYITLNELLERFNSQSVHQVLHTGVGAHIAVAVIALRGQDSL